MFLDLKLISKYRASLMGIAMISILLGHYHGLSDSSHWKFTDVICSVFPGLFMSETFLLVSGFGLYYAYSKIKNRNKRALMGFYQKRLRRVLLPFILFSFPFFLYALYIGKLTGIQFCGYLTTLSFWFEGNYYSMWYIAISLMLYALFPVLFGFLFRVSYNKIVVLRFICLMTVLYSFLYTIKIVTPDYYSLVGIGLTQIPCFIIGMYFGYISSNEKSNIGILNISLCIFLPFIVLKLVSVFFPDIDYIVKMMQRILGLMVFCFVMEKSAHIRMLRSVRGGVIFVLDFIGKVTLEIYIFHLLIFYLFKDMGLMYCNTILILSSIWLALMISYPVHKYSNNFLETIMKL